MTKRAVIALAVLAGCGSDGADYGQEDIALDAPCQGIATLTGAAILAQRTEHMEVELSYVTAAGARTMPTALTMDITWPTAPVATCYPRFMETGAAAVERVIIEGLTLKFKTADGKFDESLPAIAVMNVNSSLANVVGITSRGDLTGSWEPFPDYTPIKNTMSLTTSMNMAMPNASNGLIGMGGSDAGELRAGIFRSGFAMATW